MRDREQDPAKVQEYQARLCGVDAERIVYIDETGVDTFLFREYGYAPKGEAVCDFMRGRDYQRAGLVAVSALILAR